MGKQDATRNKALLAEKNRLYSESIEYYKEIAEKHRKEKKYTQDFSFVLYKRIKNYFERLDDKPITNAGLILASGMTKHAWENARRGDYDHDLYVYMDNHDCSDVFMYDNMPCVDMDGEYILLVPLSEIIENALLRKEDETETRLYQNGRVGDIFALKAKHGWIEEEKAPHTVNQTLVIASPSEAQEAIKLLK